ncbi:hypothetical protein Bca101_102036 [Brassica carinata]
MVRLVFRPYTQVRRAICVSIAAGLHQSFLGRPLRHSSPSFGSRQVCSHSNPSRKIKVGRLCTVRIQPISFLTPYGFTHPVDSHTCQTPWSVFQGGSNGSPQAGARARRCEARRGACCRPRLRQRRLRGRSESRA